MNDPLITEFENNEMTEMPDKEFKNIILNEQAPQWKKKWRQMKYIKFGHLVNKSKFNQKTFCEIYN